MKKVLFVCHGNICRSPMAEFILKSKRSDIYCQSRATSFEESGNDIYPPAKATLDRHQIPYNKHKAKRITQDDYEEFDYIFVMDENNLRNIKKIVDDKDNKIRKLLDEDIEDPWYTGNFEKVYRQIEKGINIFINSL